MADYITPSFIQKVDIPFWEHDAFVLDGDLYRAGFKRHWTQWSDHSVIIEKYDTSKNVFFRVGVLQWNNGLGSAHVADGCLFIFGTTNTATSGNSIKRRKVDTTKWEWDGEETEVYTAPANVKIYNTSVTRGPDRWVVAYETNEATPFSLRFLQSKDNASWEPLGGIFHEKFYSACPSIDYVGNDWYVVTYLWNNGGTYETAIARTKDFVSLETFQGNKPKGLTAFHQLISPDGHEGKNNSDFSMAEFNGRVYMVYLIGDQKTWGNRGEAWFDGTMSDLYDQYWS